MNCSLRFFAALALAAVSFLAPPVRAQEPSFQGLGFLPGTASAEATGVSADGSVVVGSSNSDGIGQAFRWTAAGGLVGLGVLPGGTPLSLASGVSADGAVVVGKGTGSNGEEAFRWTEAGGMVGLGDLPGGTFSSQALGVSADGRVAVGVGARAAGVAEAFRWEGGVMAGLGSFPGGNFNNQAHAVSADGSVVVGQGITSAAGVAEAFRWEGGVMAGLGFLPGGSTSAAFGVSADGSVVVGRGTGSNGLFEAFRWTAADGMAGLGDLPGGSVFSQANAASADGRVIVGQGASATAFEAFVWTAAGGMVSLRDSLGALGLDLTGWILFRAHAVSADGRTVVGHGINPQGRSEAFRAVLGGGHRWVNAAGGAWDVAANWSHATVPDSTDATAFDLDGTYTVTGPAALGGRRARSLAAAHGTVDFGLDGLALTSRSADVPSLTVSFDATAKIVAGTATMVHTVVGFADTAPGDTTTTARLQVFNSGTLLAGSGVLFAVGSGGRGEVFVAGGQLRTAGASVGLTAIGEVVVGNGGTWDVTGTSMSVGGNVTGRVRVEAGGGVTAGEVFVGASRPGPSSFVDVAGFGAGGRSRLFVAGRLRVGDDGPSALRVRDGATVTAGSVVLGAATDDGPANLHVGGASAAGVVAELVAGSVTVGAAGTPDAYAEVLDGGAVEAVTLRVGEAGSVGYVLVSGAATLSARGAGFTGACVVADGVGADAVLSVEAGGFVECDQAGVGTLGSALVFVGEAGASPAPSTLVVSGVLVVGQGNDGTLQLAGGVVDAVDAASSPPADPEDVVVNAGGRIEGTGVLVGRVLSIGFVGPGVTVVPPPLAPGRHRRAGSESHRGGAPGGTLLVRGAFTQGAGGVLEVALAGPDSTRQGRLRVRPAHGMEGSAALGGTLRLAFQDGYAPHTGDTFALLDAASVSGAFAATEVTGLQPGWTFAVAVENGAVVVTSLSDGAVGDEPAPVAAPSASVLHAPVPNPSSGRVALAFDLASAGPARLAVYDVLGREVAVLADGERPAGRHEATLETERLAPGVYAARLVAGTAVQTQRLTVVR